MFIARIVTQSSRNTSVAARRAGLQIDCVRIETRVCASPTYTRVCVFFVRCSASCVQRGGKLETAGIDTTYNIGGGGKLVHKVHVYE